MNKFFKSFLLLVAFVLSAPLVQSQVTGDPIKREFRSVWLAALGVDFSSSNLKSMVDQTVNNLEGSNYTSICFHVRPMADALYKSNLAPWSSYASGTRGKAPSYDPLQYAIDAAHAKGLELYAWLNPYRWENSTTVSYSTSYDQEWKSKGWGLAGSSQTVLNPGMPEVRAHVVEIVKEIINNYDVDGIIFDDYFYPAGGMVETSKAADYQLYLQYRTSSSQTIADWRRSNVDQMVADVYAAIQSIKPDVRFGVSPRGNGCAPAAKLGFPTIPSSVRNGDGQYDGIYCAPLQWMKDGTIDFISPQCYWPTDHSTAPYEPLSKWWADCLPYCDRDVHLYVSQGPYYDGGQTSSEISTQSLYNREYTPNNAPGFIMFSAKWLTDDFNKTFKSRVSSSKVLQPKITWFSEKYHAFSAPTNARKSGSTLSWDAQSYGKRIVKYTVYAVPTSVSFEAAQSNDGDGISAEYLLGITYNNSYTLPSNKTSGYWYAVCVYDGFSVEWDPALIGISQDPAPTTTLTSPSNGATVTGVFSLKWSNVDVNNYVVEVSKSSDFSSIAYETSTTSTSVSLSSTDLGNGTYYWRVITHKDGFKASTSSSRSFVVSISAAPATSLVSPAAGSTVKGVFSLSWSSASVDSYTVEVSKSSNFTSTVYSKNLTSTSVSLDAADLGEGTYYWRVKTHKAAYRDNVTDSRTFVVAPVPNAALPTLLSPANDAVVEGAFQFAWTNANVDSYTLQVSNSSDFSNILYTIGTNSTTVSQTGEFFGRGVFYWRVISHASGYKDATTDAYVFKIEKISTGHYEEGYVIKTDGQTYTKYGDLTLSNIWTRSSSLGNFEQGSTEVGNNGTFNRDFVVVGDYVYVAGREENSSSALCYLSKYDRFTGEHISDIILGEEAQQYYYPCNNLTKDSKGVVCISNLVLSPGSNPLVLHKVNLETGELSEIASLTYSQSTTTLSAARFDHCEVYGDVESGSFYVFAAVPAKSVVVRWTIKNGSVSATEYTRIRTHYPSSAASFGIAPSIIPVSATDFYVDGELTALTRYTFKAGTYATLVDSFNNASFSEKMTKASYYNGAVIFSFNGENYIGYTSTYETSTDDVTENHQFDIVKVNANRDYSSMGLRWRLPANSGIFGNANSTSKQAPMDYADNADGSGTVYAYVPGAGIAAYTLAIDKGDPTGVESIEAESDLVITVAGRRVSLNAEASYIAVHNLAGCQVALGEGSELYLDVAPGYYVVRAIVNGKAVAKGIIIR